MRKSTFQRIALVAVFSCFVSTEGANAQVAVGVGVYGGPRPYPRYPFFGAYPLNYPGFYGNGMSLYGPPVPTYGSTPGTFGASDNRVNQNGPAFGGPIGVYATFPRSRWRPDAETVQPVPAADALMVEVRVPLENAVVFVNEQVTKQNGHVRYYSSPSLATGENYRYTVRAVWTIDGKHNDRTVTVEGKPGERLLADFTH